MVRVNKGVRVRVGERRHTMPRPCTRRFEWVVSLNGLEGLEWLEGRGRSLGHVLRLLM